MRGIKTQIIQCDMSVYLYLYILPCACAFYKSQNKINIFQHHTQFQHIKCIINLFIKNLPDKSSICTHQYRCSSNVMMMARLLCAKHVPHNHISPQNVCDQKI